LANLQIVQGDNKKVISFFVSVLWYTYSVIFVPSKDVQRITMKEVTDMKGYIVECGYMGYIDGQYQLFADEQDYREAFCEDAR